MTDVNAGSGSATSSPNTGTDAATDAHEGGGFAAIDAAAGGSSAPLGHHDEPEGSAPKAEAKDEGSEGGEEAGRLRASLKKIADRADEIRSWGSDRQEDARDLVEAKPLTVVGAAFGVGLLLGLVASRV